MLIAFFATASVLVASVCLCRLEALVSLAVTYYLSCQLAFPGYLALPGGWCLTLGDSLFGGSGPMAASHWVLLSPSTYNLAWSSYFMGGDLWEVAKVTPSLFAFRPNSFAYCLHCSQLAPTLHFHYFLSTS